VIDWRPPHPITFELAAAPEGGTDFVLRTESSAEHAARGAAGWEGCLDQLQFARETESWTDLFDHYVVAFEPVLGPQEGPPEGFQVS